MGLRAGQGVLRRKPIEHIQEAEGTASEQLTRALGLWQLTAIGVGGIIGAGIFTLAGTVANGKAGPAVLISFLIAGIASAAAAFSYAEFAGLIPKAGSAYTYGYAVLGELAGWFIGWDLLLEYTAIVAVVAIGISGYFGFLLGEMGVELPAWMLGAPGTGPGHRVDLFAAVLCLLIAYLLTLGIKNAARFETVVVGLKVLVVIIVIAVGAIIGILTVMFTFMLGVTRVWFSMSRDGLLPKWFAKTSPKHHVPTRVTWIVGFASAAIAGFLPIGEAAELTNIGILLAFAVVCVAVIVLRYKRPDLPRTFRTPGMPVVPAIGVCFSIWLITFLAWQTWVRFVLWFVLGMIIYLAYSYRHSNLARADRERAGGESGGTRP
ncbi:amino acid permease [Streptomyces decoyicus]